MGRKGRSRRKDGRNNNIRRNNSIRSKRELGVGYGQIGSLGGGGIKSERWGGRPIGRRGAWRGREGGKEGREIYNYIRPALRQEGSLLRECAERER